MNAPIAFLLFFAFLGLFDKIRNNKWGLAEELDKGLTTMGSLAFSMGGIYCAALLLGEHLSRWLETHHLNLPFDLSIITSSVLATDMGAYTISSQISAQHSVVVFSGILLSSMLGTTISFTLPVAIGSTSKENLSTLMHGFVYGIISIPFALFFGALVMRMPSALLWKNLLPIIVICTLLCVSIIKAKSLTIRIFSGLGTFIQILSCLLFGLIIFEIYRGETILFDISSIHEILLIVLKICTIVCGSFVFSKLILRYFMNQILFFAHKLKINEFAIIGLLLNCVTSISMLSIFDKMDKRGQMMNAAAAVTGSYFLGGQLAFVAAMENGSILAYMAAKILGGIISIAIVSFFCPPVEE